MARKVLLKDILVVHALVPTILALTRPKMGGRGMARAMAKGMERVKAKNASGNLRTASGLRRIDHASSTSRMDHARRDTSATFLIKKVMSRRSPFARNPSKTH